MCTAAEGEMRSVASPSPWKHHAQEAGKRRCNDL
jgi:hypothetical protein